jgi:hypothetical protein
LPGRTPPFRHEQPAEQRHGDLPNGVHATARAALRAKSSDAGQARMAINRVHRSILLSAVERYGSLFFFFLVSTAILSRLLSPTSSGFTPSLMR